MVQNNSKEKLDQLMDSQVQKKVEYTDKDGNKQIKNVTFQNAGIEVATQLIDYMQGEDSNSDWSSIFDILMSKVIVNPKMTFEDLDKQLDKKYKTKTVKKTNKNGEEINLNFKFPNYRNALEIVFSVSKTNGALKLTDTLNRLNKQVITNDQKEQVSMDYWNIGGHGVGLGMVAYQEALSYLAEVLEVDGVRALLLEAFQFIQSAVSVDNI